MHDYDIVFIGHINRDTVVPFGGSPFTEECSPVTFAGAAASCLGRRIAGVTRIPESEACLLEPLETAGVRVFVLPGKTTEGYIVFPTANVDQRQIFRIRLGEPFAADELPPLAPCLIHLCCFDARGFLPELMRALKTRGFRLSVDMMGIMLHADETGAAHLEDIPEKKELLSIADFVKVDVAEALILTGAHALQEQADILEGWGSSETIITCSEGVLVQRDGKSVFAKFTNTSTRGRMGRGDTCMGAYLTRRLDHSPEDSLRFAAALTSIKLESPGPFKGSLNDVFERMDPSCRITAGP
jgi:sugar/nucleoside kinase (ribokinase family)